MSASAQTIVKPAEESGNFFTRMAWYYQMGVLLLLAGLLYFAADYLCSISWVSAASLMPIFVTVVAGATTNAYYALAWAVALPLYTVCANVGMSLVLHGTNDRDALPALARRAALHGVRLLFPATAVVVLFAPQLLSLFGSSDTAASAPRLPFGFVLHRFQFLG